MLCHKPIGYGNEYMVNDVLTRPGRLVIAHADCLSVVLLSDRAAGEERNG